MKRGVVEKKGIKNEKVKCNLEKVEVLKVNYPNADDKVIFSQFGGKANRDFRDKDQSLLLLQK